MADQTTVGTAEVVLRAGIPADVAAVRSLAEAVLPPTYGPIAEAYPALMLEQWWSLERIARSLDVNAHVLAEVDGTGGREVVAMSILGWLSRSHREFPHVQGDREVMWKLYVHPDHQGLGLGSRLLAEVEAMVEGDELWLEVVDGNTAAVDFYTARGFVEAERVDNDPWPDDVWFRKTLEKDLGAGRP